MRHIGRAALVLVAAALLAQCSDDSSARVRIRNSTVDKANVSLKDNAGNTTNINDVAGGTTTAYEDFGAGPYDVTATVQNEANPLPISFTVIKGDLYTIRVGVGTPPVLSVLQP